MAKAAAGDAPPPLGHLPLWADALGLAGEEREAFFEAGQRAKAAGKKDIAPYVQDLEDDVEDLEAHLLRMQAAFRALVALFVKQGGKLPYGFLERFGLEPSAEDAGAE